MQSLYTYLNTYSNTYTNIYKICGDGRIRTPDTLRYAGFRNRCIQPLCHISVLFNLAFFAIFTKII